MKYQINPVVGRDRVSTGFRTVSSFDSRSYYSGSDVRFEFGNIPVDDIANISYKLIESKKFHYGYASRTATHISSGQRLVQGQIVTNFKDPGQMRYILKALRDNAGDPVQTGKESLARQLVLNNLIGNGTTSDTDFQNLIGVSPSKANRDNLIERLRIDSATPKYEVMQAFRDALWGIPANDSALSSTPLLSDPSRQIKLDCGPDGFDIRMIFGEPDVTPKKGSSRPSQLGAVVLISGVQIMSEGLEVNETGEPLRTIYEFIARDSN